MIYKIFRLAEGGWLVNIGYRDYKSYIEAERVVKALKETNKRKQNYIILKMY